jgi:hypothetical protein
MNNIRENKLINLYTSKGAKLFNGHGMIMRNVKEVPKNTALMFLSEPGYCMYISTGAGIQKMFFENENGLKNFMRSGRANGKHIEYVNTILSRTHFPRGTFPGKPHLNNPTYPNMWINLLPNKTFKGMGYVKKLPLTQVSVNAKKQPVPRYRNTVGPLVPGRYRLSDLLERNNLKTGGVFVISACRVHENNVQRGVPTEVHEGQEYKRLKRHTISANTVLSMPIVPPKPGSRPTQQPTINLNNNTIKSLTNLFLKIRQQNNLEKAIKINQAKNILYNNSQRRSYSNLRNVLARVNLPANFGRNYPQLLEHFQNVFNHGIQPNSVRKLRSGSQYPTTNLKKRKPI